MAHEVLVAISLVGVYILFVVLKWVHKRRRLHTIFERYNIPGPKPSFLDGNMNQLKAAPTPNDVITGWLKEYGPVFGYFMGETPYLVVKDLEMLKQVLIKDFSHFTDRPDMYLETKPSSDTVLALKGERWKRVRNILTPTFSSSKMKMMYKTMNDKMAITLDIVGKHAERNEIFDIYENFQGLTMDGIAECALAMKVNCQRDNKDPFLIAVRNFIKFSHSTAVDLAVKFPFISSIFLFLDRFYTAGQMTTMIVKNVTEQINKRRDDPGARKVDLLQIMLEATNPEANEKSGKRQQIKLTDEDVVANAFMFLLAGYETTSTALAFTFWLLIHHEDIQEKLYHEILEASPDGDLNYDRLQTMQYLDQVFNESMRLYPPVTGFISRQCREECQVGNYTIPKDVIVIAPIWDIHRDPELWPNPLEFDPDRFAPENKSMIQSLSFLPFGTGPRNCIGMRFALLEAKLAIASLILKFRFVPCEKTDNPLTLVSPTLAINPAKGVHVRAIMREQNSL